MGEAGSTHTRSSTAGGGRALGGTASFLVIPHAFLPPHLSLLPGAGVEPWSGVELETGLEED